MEGTARHCLEVQSILVMQLGTSAWECEITDMKNRSPGVTGEGHRQLSVMHSVYCSTDTFLIFELKIIYLGKIVNK